MSVVIKSLFILIFSLSCQWEDPKVISARKSNHPYFSTREVVTGLNALVAIVDWPEETLSIQKNLSVNPQLAQKLILPLHPIWDEKIMETAAEIPSWDQKKISSIISGCEKSCECIFYQEVLDRNPDLLEQSSVELKNLAGLKIIKTKEKILKCLDSMPSLQKLLDYLKNQQKIYESDSAI